MAGPGVPGNARAAMWGDKTLCDTMVNVHSDEGDHQEAPLASIPVHGVVLAEVSEVFRRHLLRLREQELQQAKPSTHSLAPASEDSSRDRKRLRANKIRQPLSAFLAGRLFVPHGLKEYQLTLMPGEPQTVPEAVLRHVYTGQLPDDPEHVIWALWRADYLDLAATVSACAAKLQQLADSKQLTLQHAVLLHQLPPLQTSSAETVQQQVTAITTATLAAQLPAAADLLRQPSLLRQFEQLPLSLVQQWAHCSSVTIDSGNSLAVLFTAWYDAQPSQPTEDQCQQLSELLPLSSLTVCFHLQALPHLSWWRPPSTTHLPSASALAHVALLLHPSNPILHDRWSHLADRSLLTCTGTHSDSWQLSYPQLKQLWADGQISIGECIPALGYLWCPSLFLESERQLNGSSVQYLTVRLALAWQGVLARHGLQRKLPRPAAHIKLRVVCELSPLPPSDKPRRTLLQNRGYWEDLWGWERCGPPLRGLHELAPGSAATLKLTIRWEAMQPLNGQKQAAQS